MRTPICRFSVCLLVLLLAAAPKLLHAQNYTDIWWNPNEPGWGLTLVDHDSQLAGVWYTYDIAGRPVWYVMPAAAFTQSRRFVSGDLYRTTGPAYNIAFNPAQVTQTRVGSASLDFAPAGLGPGIVLFTATVGGVSQAKQIQRTPFGSAAARWGSDYGDIWWDAAQAGWGLAITQHGDMAGAVWYTYGLDGQPLWVLMPAVRLADASSFNGKIYTATGPAFSAAAFDPARVKLTEVGTAFLNFFSDGHSGTFYSQVNGFEQIKNIGALLFGSIAPYPAALAQWEKQMTEKGRLNCDRIMDPAVPDEQKTSDDYIYYDAAKVYAQIADYTRAKDPGSESYWRACAARANRIYRDLYALKAECYGGGVGCVSGYHNFTTGMRMDFEKNADLKSKTTAILLSQHASFASDAEPVSDTVTPARSREVAYAIRSYIDAELLGEPRRPRLADMVNNALGHIDQWFISKSYSCPLDCDPQAAVGQYYIQPFMVGLTCEALIRYFGRTQDARVVPAVKVALDWIWDNAWMPGEGAFWYDRWAANSSLPFPATGAGGSPAPDLNLLIAPAYAWVYSQTGDTKYRDRGDQIFAGGVRKPYLDSGKQFDQNYFWSFDYLAWR
jgi:hypothetical protein